MNVLFHTTAAIGVVVMLTDTTTVGKTTLSKIQVGVTAFFVGVISHGALDYIPHCYPINPKIDVIVGFIIISALTFMSHQKYRVIVALAFLGGIFPDLIDLSPQILNKYLGLNLPINDKIFPWHWEKYSGSIFIDDCKTSALNHTILVLVVMTICFRRRTDFKNIFLSRIK